MCTVLVSYDPSNQMASHLMSALSLTEGVEIDNEVWATDEEIERWEKSRNSGICTDIDKLQEYLKSQYVN